MALIVRKPGLWTTVQDAGRTGWQRYGVPVGGPMDAASHAAANVLAGNEPGAAALELTLAGGAFETTADVRIAVCGADLEPYVDDAPLPMWRPVVVPAGTTIRFGTARAGRYAYVAVAGGFDTPQALGSRSTAAKGGFEASIGRPLQVGDRLPIADPAAVLASAGESRSPTAAYPRWHLGEAWRFSAPDAAGERTVRALRGREWERFDPIVRGSIERGEWTCTVQSASDRMGYRMAASLPAAVRTDQLSEAVTAGTVQVPPDGMPIALMADRQTTGGYPRLLQIAAVDIGLLAQARPGDVVRFELIELEQAVDAYMERLERLRWLRERIRWAEREEEGRSRL
ncbi:biotin-dependent carboxyltransferase family protein [Paenibacillus sp.]|uniref:5-oxoprolinase subunit C family protein n=1 Tax=Paenibacillus sp. TaxID=58172 RepID=UPI002D2248DD|nr:biotin-dependent carboxyltransferase family protein [Paenibacillus sp.]HZG56773.1 biotin-dependent carboxyltransferase family protein [Paenibacillus sp.]